MAGGSLGGGGGGGKGNRGGMITEINVTPLVDIMLVLLIIFMVTASYIVRDSIDVKLPEASTGQKQKVSILAVTISKSGDLQLNGKPTTNDDIRRFIRQMTKKGKLEAVIAADRRVSHGQVVKIIDLVREEGVLKFAINVLKSER